jgi:hypothetical protein
MRTQVSVLAEILDEIEPQLLSREAAGQSREEAIFAETDCGCTDLVIDLRERLLGAVEGAPAAERGAPATHHETDLVLLAPSTVVCPASDVEPASVHLGREQLRFVER